METITTSSSRLKAKLGRYLGAVRKGQDVIVTDRGRPIARIVPLGPSVPRGSRAAIVQPADPGAPPLGELVVRPIRCSGPTSTALLLEDRSRR